MGKSAIRDLVYRIEGFGDEPDYEIQSIEHISGGKISVVISCEKAARKDGASDAQGVNA